MKNRPNFLWFVIISTTCTILIITIPAILFWNGMSGEQQSVIRGLFPGHFQYIFIPAALILLGYGLVLEWFFNSYIRPLNRLREETDLINTVAPSLRVQVEGSNDITSLARIINRGADQYEALNNDIQKKIANAIAETEIEKNIFASIVSELTEGIVICNTNGQILLCNLQAKQILSKLGSNGDEHKEMDENTEPFIGIGRSIFTVIDKYLLEHAIDDITTKLKKNRKNVSTSFVMVDREQKLFRVEAVPILDSQRLYKGFILIISNITEELENDTHITSHLNTLLENVRTKLTTIRTSAELIHDYPEMDPDKSDQFLKIIFKETKLLSDIINQSAFNFPVKIKNKWPLVPVSIKKLLYSVKEKVNKVWGITIELENCDISKTVRVDKYSIKTALSFIILLLAKETKVIDFVCDLKTGKVSIDIIIKWKGDYIKTDLLQTWSTMIPHVENENIPISLKDVLENHEIEMYSFSDRETQDVSYLHLSLPSCEDTVSDSKPGITVLTGNRPEFYDFDLFYQATENPELENRPLKDLTYTVFDTETTGLDPRNGDEIISIAALRIVNLRLLRDDVYDQLVNPKYPPSLRSIQIHGIKPESLVDQPAIGQVLPAFERFAEDSVIVAHNAAFDMCVIQMQEKETNVRITNPVLDTMLLSAVVHPDYSDHSLEEIAKRLGVNIINRHTALGDAIAAGEIFLKLVTLLAAQGVNTLKEAHTASKKTYLARQKY